MNDSGTAHHPVLPDPGTLVVVGTPIGNLGDLSPRAASVLAAVDVIACEDTRRTGRLLELAGIDRPDLLVLNEHTEQVRTGDIIERLDRGGRVGLVSDAGMPTVADPGRRLVAAVADAGHPVVAVPGPAAVTTALALSGFPADRFVFEGFLPRKGRDRADRLRGVAREASTVVVYESPHRIARTLADLAAVCGGERPAAVARELTKRYEEVLRGRLDELRDRATAEPVRGEIVVVIGPSPASSAPDVADDELVAALRHHILAGATRRDAVAEVVTATGTSKRRVYDLVNRLDREAP
ncbi:MAG: 16S rRNA (cytidine(1402)-2'-O)-methyltransferase [Acidimicrobiales bacterium]